MASDLRSEELLYLAADLPSPGGVKVLSTTLPFHEAAGGDRRRVASALREILGMRPGDRLLLGNQVHGAAVENVDCPKHEIVDHGAYAVVMECDGLVTSRKGTAIMVRTADCVPVVLSAATRPWLAVVHAGWRGTLAGITDRAVACAREQGIEPAELHAWIGPHIASESYEVADTLARQFNEKFAAWGEVARGRMLDLGQANRLALQAAGIPAHQILQCGRCTYSEPAIFPSYRRDGRCRGQIYTAARLTP